MRLSRRAFCRAVLGPLVAAPLGLLSGCSGASDSPPVAATEKPRLLSPDVVAQSLRSVSAQQLPWRAASASAVEPVRDEGVFRLPSLPHGELRLAQAPQPIVPGPFFPEHSPPPAMAHDPPHESPELVGSDGAALEVPSELTAEEIADVHPLPVLKGEPPIGAPQSEPTLAPLGEEAEDAAHRPANAPSPLPWASPAAVSDPAMQAVVARAAEQVREGFALANRGAYFSARSEFIAALRTLSQALDAQQGTRLHGDALAAGLRALEESDDFVPQGSRVESDLHIGSVLPAHQTPLLKDVPLDDVTPLLARRRYYTYAQEQLGLAAGQDRAGSMALFGLAKVQIALAQQNPNKFVAAEPKAMALYQAALLADGQNYLAANELGVLLARFRLYEHARSALLHTVRLAPLPTAWHNLAVVQHHLGEAQLAARAEQHAQVLAKQASSAQLAGQQPPVIWTDPATFARVSSPGEGPPLRGHTASAPRSAPALLQR